MGTVIGGIETTADAVAAALRTPVFSSATHDTDSLAELPYRSQRLEVVRPGTQTTVQAWPGRQGYWDVGVPPSGPMDDLSFRWGNLALGNEEGAAGLEATLEGPALRFSAETPVCVTGAPAEVRVNGAPAPMWEPFTVGAGGVLDIGRIGPPGIRACILVAGGLDCTRVSRQRRHLHPRWRRRARRARAARGGRGAAGRGRHESDSAARIIRSTARTSPTTGS